MGKSFRFLLQFALVNLTALFVCAVVLIVGCYATGVPYHTFRHNTFEIYYSMSPFMILLFLFLYAFALCTSSLNLGLSFGARRRDFFWAVQGIILLYAALCWALQRVLSGLPAAAGWVDRDQWNLLALYSGKVWTYPLLCVTLLVLGCLFGLLMARRRVLAIFLFALVCLALSGSTAVMLLFADTRMVTVLTGDGWGWLFTTLPKALTAVLAVSAVGGELLIWRVIQTYTVR